MSQSNDLDKARIDSETHVIRGNFDAGLDDVRVSGLEADSKMENRYAKIEGRAPRVMGAWEGSVSFGFGALEKFGVHGHVATELKGASMPVNGHVLKLEGTCG